MKRCCLIGIFMLAPLAPAIALTPLPDFKLDGYVATWYEIASIRGFLQSRCARDTRTEYSIGENGALMLESKCLRADGTPERSEARARPMDPALPSVLKITTVHMLGIWWYPFGRESIVVARGPDRRWLAVGHPSLRYARILAPFACAVRRRPEERGRGAGRSAVRPVRDGADRADRRPAAAGARCATSCGHRRCRPRRYRAHCSDGDRTRGRQCDRAPSRVGCGGVRARRPACRLRAPGRQRCGRRCGEADLRLPVGRRAADHPFRAGRSPAVDLQRRSHHALSDPRRVRAFATATRASSCAARAWTWC